MAQLWIINPKGGKPKKARLVMAKAKRRRSAKRGLQTNPKRRRRFSGLRRNPIGRGRTRAAMGGLMATLTAGGLGAAGGVAVDLVMRPMPAAIKTGMRGELVRAGVAVALGAAGAAMRTPWLQHMGNGALSISLYGFARRFTVPMGLGDMSETEGLAADLLYEREMAGLGEYVGDGLGEYVADAPQLGYADGSSENLMSGLGVYEDA